MFLKNFWYVAATEDEVGRTPLGREICGEPVALWRQEDGTAVAISDRCPHRRYALSKGELVGDDIQCGYHGLRFDGQGACTHVPGQDNIPPRLKGRCYPVVERHKWVFIWMGDIEDADPDLIPDYHWNDAEGWEPVFGTMKFAAHYQLLVDNLLDLTHETYVHARTIGNAAVAETPMTTRAEGDDVFVERLMPDCPPPPLFKRARGFTTNIDRWQKIRFSPPANIWIDAGGAPAGTNDMDSALRWMVLNAITPENEGSTHYFWSVSRCFSQDDPEISALVHNQIVNTFEEDREILETQQRLIETDEPGKPLMSVNCDAGNVAARKIVDRLIKAERETAA